MSRVVGLILAVFMIQACGDESVISSGTSISQPASGICTKDINQYGNPSTCECLKGSTYDQVTGGCSAAGRLEKKLSWTLDSDSLQAKLYQGISYLKNGASEVRTPVVALAGLENIITCESGTPDMISAQQYRCAFDLESDMLRPTADEQSVQAMLYDIVSALDPKEMLGGLVSISDTAGNEIVCKAETQDLIQMVNYSCQFSFSDGIQID